MPVVGYTQASVHSLTYVIVSPLRIFPDIFTFSKSYLKNKQTNSKNQTVKNVQLHLQTTEMGPKQLFVTLSVRE